MKELLPINNDEYTSHISEVEKYGTKYAVQKMFYEMGMCSVETRLFTSEETADSIQTEIDKLNKNEKGITVRFSYQDNLNLPRGFFKDSQECMDFISKERKNYSVILQEYTTLVNSFEVYYTGDSFYLQVLPGIWEVDTNESPDIIEERDNKLTIWRYKQKRHAKFVDEDNKFYTQDVVPFETRDLVGLFGDIKKYKDKLEEIRSIYNPLFCHFYQDDKGRFSFINVRNFGTVPINGDSPSVFSRLSSVEDLETLDTGKPILFNIKANRDNDAAIHESIITLKKKGIKQVYVNYGILSHPAILLREAGIEVKQSYALYERREITPE